VFRSRRISFGTGALAGPPDLASIGLGRSPLADRFGSRPQDGTAVALDHVVTLRQAVATPSVLPVADKLSKGVRTRLDMPTVRATPPLATCEADIPGKRPTAI
jgi:hypothetical protein